MSDSAAVDDALYALLANDAALTTLLPDRVWFDEAPPDARRFAIVSFVDEADARRFEGRSHEDALYLVKAVVLQPPATTTAGAAAADAAARIDALLEGALLSPVGYQPMACYREQRVRYTETDRMDATLRWLHRGGRYRVVVSVGTS